MRALEGQAADCRRPAMNLYQRAIVLRVGIRDILACNAQGAFFIGGECVPAVSPGHDFQADYTGDPDNRDALSFNNPDGSGGPFGLIGGADGKDVTCAPVAECTDPCDPDTELTEGDQTSIVYNTTRACGGDCQSTRLTCGADGSLSARPAGWSGIACECPDEECDGCTDPCTGASLDDGDTTGFLYKEPRACGESCTSTHLTCNNGTLSDPPSDWEDTACSCPAENCGGCLADTLSWTVAGHTCEGSVPSTDDSDTETATNDLPGLTGEADFTCSDEEWGPPTNARCEPVGPVTCPADSDVSWAPGCIASLGETNAPDDVTVTDNTGDYTGSATYPCQSDGTWGTPTNVSCCELRRTLNCPNGYIGDGIVETRTSCSSAWEEDSRDCERDLVWRLRDRQACTNNPYPLPGQNGCPPEPAGQFIGGSCDVEYKVCQINPDACPGPEGEHDIHDVPHLVCEPR